MSSRDVILVMMYLQIGTAAAETFWSDEADRDSKPKLVGISGLGNLGTRA